MANALPQAKETGYDSKPPSGGPEAHTHDLNPDVAAHEGAPFHVHKADPDGIPGNERPDKEVRASKKFVLGAYRSD